MHSPPKNPITICVCILAAKKGHAFPSPLVGYEESYFMLLYPGIHQQLQQQEKSMVEELCSLLKTINKWCTCDFQKTN